MTHTINLLMQDIVFLIKRSLENSFYCESLNLCESIQIKINQDSLIDKYSNNEIKEAFDLLGELFFNEVTCKCKPKSISFLRLVDRISFSDTTIYFSTFQFYVNRLYKVDFSLTELVQLPN